MTIEMKETRPPRVDTDTLYYSLHAELVKFFGNDNFVYVLEMVQKKRIINVFYETMDEVEVVERIVEKYFPSKYERRIRCLPQIRSKFRRTACIIRDMKRDLSDTLEQSKKKTNPQ